MKRFTRLMSAAVAALFLVGASANGSAAQQDQAIPQDTLEQEQQQDTLQQAQIDAPSGYVSASEVTGLPQMVPGLGILFVKQENLPVGPFLAYSPDGELLSSVIFLPTQGTGTMQDQPGQEYRQRQDEEEWQRQQEEEQRQQEGQREGEREEPQQEWQQQGQEGMQQQLDMTKFGEIELEEEQVDHMEIRFNRGFSAARSGLDQPHYQLILWHVSQDRAQEIEQLGISQRQTPEERREYGQREDREREEARDEETREFGEREAEARREEEQRTGVAEMEMDVEIDAPSGYEKASEIAQLPRFVPDVGILYVEPNNVPVGPYLAYDREGEQVSTVFMVPTEEMTGQTMQQLQLEKDDVDHVAIEFTQGVSGASSPLDRPHYRVILWHVSPEDARNVSRFQGDRQENR